MMKQGKKTILKKALLNAAVISAMSVGTMTVHAQDVVESPSPPPPLSANINKDLPAAPWIDKFVNDTRQAKEYLDVLGKAFFWDQQVGSDGMACASCHSVAGIDQRSKNALNPGSLAGDTVFDVTATGGGGINYQLKSGDFPFHQKVDPNSRDEGANIAFDTNDVASSMGVFNLDFNGVDPVNHTILDDCSPGESDEFDGVRRVEPRHTPTIINAALNFDQFWDGRANNVFNGGVLGLREFVELFKVDSVTGSVVSGALEDLVDERLENGALASQAVGPIESSLEMSCAGRDAADIGEKLMDKTPLYFQQVHKHDHLFKGHLREYDGKIKYTYRELIQATFLPEWWDSADLVSLNGRQYEMIEANFPIFFGLAVMAYERRLVSNMSKYDLVHRDEGESFTAEEESGQDVFLNKGKCVNCHATAVFTKASTLHLVDENEEEGLVERMLMGDQSRGPALYDNGWYNIAVTRTTDDLSRGVEFLGDPLSFTRQYIEMLRGKNAPDPFEIDECKFEIRFDGSVFPGNLETIQCKDSSSTLKPSLPGMEGDAQDMAIKDMRTAVDGAQKVSGLRNLSVQGPYFHNGGSLNLQQVIQFYDRGGNFFNFNQVDVDPDIRRLNLTDEEKANLEAFLRTLDDPNVLDEARQFSRPQLFIPEDGTVTGAQMESCMTGAGPCTGIIIQPAIGKKGRSAEGLPPLVEFEDTL